MNRPADYIIIRFVEGNASEDELREVSSWVEESEDNARELFQLEAAWHRLEAQKMPAAQMEQALRRVWPILRRAESPVRSAWWVCGDGCAMRQLWCCCW